MMEWLKEHDASIGQLAKQVGVESSSAHAWRWRDSMPRGAVLIALCKVITSKPEDWSVDGDSQQAAAS